MSPPVPRVLRGPAAALWLYRFGMDTVSCASRATARFGPAVAFEIGLPLRRGRRFVLVAGPRFNQQVLGDGQSFRNIGLYPPGPRDSAQRRLRAGMTRTVGPELRDMRRQIMPVFKRSSVEGHVRGIAARTVEVVSSWHEGGTIDVAAEARRTGLLMTADFLLGGIDENRARQVLEQFDRWLKQVYSPMSWAFPLPVPILPYGKMLVHAARLEELLRRLIHDRRARVDAGDDMLGRIVRFNDEQEGLSEIDLHGHVAFMFLATFETSSTALAWALFLLAQHGEIWRQLKAEVRERLGNAPPDPVALDEMPLMDRVIREVMRIVTPVPTVVRVVQNPVELDGLPLLKGDRVMCSLYGTHHSPDLYEEPERFNPDRWLTIKRGAFEYVPFGYGAHSCLGIDLATLFLKTTLTIICQRATLSVVEGTRINRRVTSVIGFRSALPMRVHAADAAPRPPARVRGQVNEMVETGPR